MTPRKRLVMVVGLSALSGMLLTTAMTIPPAGWTVNDVTTGTSSAYPDLKPHLYNMPVMQTAEVAGAVAATVLHWKIVRSDREAGVIVAETRSRLGLVTDEITVTVRPQDGNAAVTIRAHSRMAGGDLGSNAQHIRELQAAMDRQLPP